MEEKSTLHTRGRGVLGQDTSHLAREGFSFIFRFVSSFGVGRSGLWAFIVISAFYIDWPEVWRHMTWHKGILEMGGEVGRPGGCARVVLPYVREDHLMHDRRSILQFWCICPFSALRLGNLGENGSRSHMVM